MLITECDEIEEWRPSPHKNISFLGQITGLDRTINIIHRRTGAEIVFGLLHRYNLDSYRMIIHRCNDGIKIPGNLPAQSSVGEKVLSLMEHYIYLHPEQWYQWKNYFTITSSQLNEKALSINRPVPILKTAVERTS